MAETAVCRWKGVGGHRALMLREMTRPEGDLGISPAEVVQPLQETGKEARVKRESCKTAFEGGRKTRKGKAKRGRVFQEECSR